MNPIKCPACDGRGSHPGSAPRKRVKCKGCSGFGLLYPLADAIGKMLPLQQPPIQLPFIPFVQPPVMPQPRHPDLSPEIWWDYPRHTTCAPSLPPELMGSFVMMIPPRMHS